jgi:RNA polymerase sigma-B factor
VPHPRAAAHALALQHLDLADAIAGNFARRTVHPFEDLRQVAIIGLLKASARYSPAGGRPFRPYTRTYANGEIMHYLRDCGFAIKVPPPWRDLHASGQKLLLQAVPPAAVPERLRVTAQRFAAGSSRRQVYLPQRLKEPDFGHHQEAIKALGTELIELVQLAGGGQWCAGHDNTSSRRS